MPEIAEESFLQKVTAFAVLMLFVPPIICFFDGMSTLFFQGSNWFKTGVWEARDFWSGVNKWFLTDRPSFEWIIPNRALNWMLDGPRWVWMFVWSIILFCAEATVLTFGLSYSERLWQRWKVRHERPLLVISKKRKIAIAITTVWLLGFPTLISLIADDSSMWGDMVGVGGVIAFWVWATIATVQQRKTKSGDPV